MEGKLNNIKSGFSGYMARRGYELVEERNYPEAFGSWYIVYKNDSRFIRLVWDGKDCEIIIEESEASVATTVSWKNIVNYTLKADLPAPAIEEIESILEKSIF
ncbi:MAG: hypothetical protein V4467_03645 [Patescibacteria group bacterium]